MTIPLHSWKNDVQVREHELDARGRLSLVDLCSHLQDAASRHANELGFSVERLGQDGLTWVLARLRIAIDARPGKDTAITVSTWPSGADGLFATRDFQIVLGRGESVACATTAWMMLDVRRRRPVRLTEDVLRLAPSDAPRSLVDDFQRMSSLGSLASERPVLTGWSDLDVNQHVNHIRYVAWMLDAIPPDIVATSEPRWLELHFRSEVGVNRSLVVRTERQASDQFVRFRQSLVDAESQTVVADASTEWLPDSSRTA